MGKRPLAATAIILAGGKSARMRCEKSLLPVHGSPMIELVYAQLRPHFSEIIVSANSIGKYSFLGVPVVPDKLAGAGPLIGILSGLETSRHDLNFVVACDMPNVDMTVVRGLIREAREWDAVVPVTTGGRLEPLFAVYRKTMIPVFTELWKSGNRRIRDAFDRCATKYVDLGDAVWLRNLNTPEEYASFVSCDLAGRPTLV